MSQVTFVDTHCPTFYLTLDIDVEENFFHFDTITLRETRRPV